MIDITSALAHFKKHDPTLHHQAVVAFASATPPQVSTPSTPEAYAANLYRSIISQQISTKAAASIYTKFLAAMGDVHNAHHIASVPTESLRTVGLSFQKASYIQNIASYAAKNSKTFATLHTLSDEEVIEVLTAIKGVGRWTAEMFLLFTLARPNVFSAGDLGLKNGIKNVYAMSSVSPQEMQTIYQKWEPHCSTASLVLWHSLQTTTH